MRLCQFTFLVVAAHAHIGVTVNNTHNKILKVLTNTLRRKKRIKLMLRIRGKKGQCQSQRRITVKAITVTDVFIQCIISYEKSLQTFTKFYFNHHSHWHEKRNEQQ